MTAKRDGSGLHGRRYIPAAIPARRAKRRRSSNGYGRGSSLPEPRRSYRGCCGVLDARLRGHDGRIQKLITLTQAYSGRRSAEGAVAFDAVGAEGLRCAVQRRRVERDVIAGETDRDSAATV